MNENNTDLTLNLDPDTQLVTVNDPTPTVSVLWDRAVQQAVINTSPGPTIGSRAYSMVHTAIYDAWSAYEDIPISTQFGDSLQRPLAENTEVNKTAAMSYSAYRVLTDLFPTETATFDAVMAQLGLDPGNTTSDTTTPAGIGNASAAALLAFRHNDGSNQLGTDANGDGTAYSDITGYQPTNATGNSSNIELWTPELVPINAQPGQEIGTQSFLTPQWGEVTPFGLEFGGQFRPVEPKPFLLVDGEVDLEARTITLTDGSTVNISRDIVGTIINPEFIEQAEEVVDFSANLTDEQKLIAEFWEDGGGTSFPPGTWMTFGQFVSARDDRTLDEDAKMFFALGNAAFDAGVATWEAKVVYDYTRPVRTIRDLGELGLIGEFNESLGGYAIEAWTPNNGTQTILATDFLTYQTPGSDPSPPFAEYTSGHSAFSAAAAEVLQLFSGSDEFGASVTFQPGESRFEPGVTPQQTLTLKWDTFTEAADEGGISRLYGGIHFEDGDVNSRRLGRQVGGNTFLSALDYIQGDTSEMSASQAVFNFEQYVRFFGNEDLLDRTSEEMGLTFDESYYLGLYEDVRAAVGEGFFESGIEHFIEFGQFEGRNPSAIFNEAYYLAGNSDVATAVEAGQFVSGLEHFNLFGTSEGRDPSPFFTNAEAFLASHPDLLTGEMMDVDSMTEEPLSEDVLELAEDILTNGQNSYSWLYDEAFYLLHNSDVAAAVIEGAFEDGFEHYIELGQFEGRNPSAIFDENAYLSQNSDVAEAVVSGQLRSGFEHFILAGRAEGRAIAF
ncbi:vanadium-dependent haloperoxidase [Zarconia navalis]|uniref:vanadium-dependent haloperoxidase n=1 Tax=Zarconia navalis TaxID=2992134 RepID=UPI0021F8C6F1|nr:vanadium-dependent haloperoxidase [Zarconia navalis]